MKRIFTTLVLISLLFVIVLPLLASAQAPDCCKLKRDIKIEDVTCSEDSIVGGVLGETCVLGAVTCGSSSWGMYCLLNTLYNVTDWLFLILMLIVVIMIIIGAFMFATAGGSPEKTMTARSFIFAAIIGLVIALIAKAVPTIVRLIMGM